MQAAVEGKGQNRFNLFSKDQKEFYQKLNKPQKFSRYEKLIDMEELLLNYKHENTPLNLELGDHRQVLADCMSEAKLRLMNLQAIDFTIAVTSICLLISCIFLPTFISLGLTFLLARNLTLRSEAVDKQQLALKNLVSAWQWGNSDAETAQELANYNDGKLIEAMRKQLYPLIDKDTFHTITDHKILAQEEELAEADLNEAAADAVDPKEEKELVHNFSKKYNHAELYEVYGLDKQGHTWVNFATSLAYSFPHVATMLYETAIDLFKGFKKEEVKAGNVEEIKEEKAVGMAL